MAGLSVVLASFQLPLRAFCISPLTQPCFFFGFSEDGAAIDGDERYGGETEERTFLHAYALTFDDQGQTIELICPPEKNGWPALPQDWQVPRQALS